VIADAVVVIAGSKHGGLDVLAMLLALSDGLIGIKKALTR
jgi:hypothetical protein